MPSLSDCVIVFDLDDTLYLELDYVHSGWKSVSRLMQNIFSQVGEIQLESYVHATTDDDIWGRVCRHLDLPLDVKESMLWAYRLHVPEIKLASHVRDWLTHLEAKTRAIAVLTDGRAMTQRLKLKALGIGHLPVYISEEWGSVKPELARFKAIEERWPDAHYVYIGDNPSKDFFAPNALGWTTIGLVDKGLNIHKQRTQDLPSNYLPSCWISCIKEAEGILTAEKKNRYPT